jgi:hypothetical protein
MIIANTQKSCYKNHAGLVFKNFHWTLKFGYKSFRLHACLYVYFLVDEYFVPKLVCVPHFQVIVALGVEVKCVLVKNPYFNACSFIRKALYILTGCNVNMFPSYKQPHFDFVQI